MRKISMKKKTAATLTAGAICLGTAAGAYAYWTTSGSGTGTASTTTGASNTLTFAQNSLNAMYPGDSAQTISGTVTNTGDQSAYVTTVTASIQSVTKAAGAPAGTCDASDYTLLSPVMNVGKDLAKNGSTGFTGATIQFNNKASNQDACKGAALVIAYAAL